MTDCNPDNEKTPVIFLHIPKSAGSTIYKILENQYQKEESYLLDGSRTPESILEFKVLPVEKKKKIRLLYGHQAFGLHRQLSQKARYFTLLRDPIDRIISHYYYVLRTQTHYLHERVTREKIGLKEYVAQGLSKELNDAQVRFISGIGFHFKFNQCPPDLLELAQTILDEFFIVVGLNEFFDETILLLKKILHWKPPVYTKQNVTGNRPRKENIDPDTLKTIHEYNRLDLELYRYATKNFKAKLASMGISFQNELKAFKRLNEHWQKFCHVLNLGMNKAAKSIKKKIIDDIIDIKVSLEAAKENETAYWFVKYASEIYPQEKEINKLIKRLSPPY